MGQARSSSRFTDEETRVKSAGPAPPGAGTGAVHAPRFLGSWINWLPAGFSQWEALAEAWRVGGSEELLCCGFPLDKPSLFHLLLSDANGRPPIIQPPLGAVASC